MNDKLITELQAAWHAAQNGECGMVELVAGVGAGKSSILAQFVEAVTSTDNQAAIVSFRCGDQSLVRSSGHGELEELVARVTEGVRVIEWGGQDTQDDARIPWLLPGIDFLHAATQIGSLPSVTGQDAIPSRAEVHAGLLIDVARHNPILIVLDDAHRTDQASKSLLNVLRAAIEAEDNVKLLVVCATTESLRSNAEQATYRSSTIGTHTIAPLSDDTVREMLRHGLGNRLKVNERLLDDLVGKIGGNPLVVHATIDHMIRLSQNRSDKLSEMNLTKHLEGLNGLWALAQGAFPLVRADIEADFRVAALFGGQFTTELVARVWSVSEAAALVRIELLVETGLIHPETDGWAFVSDELAAQWTDQTEASERDQLHVRIATIMRLDARMSESLAGRFHGALDVTETWSESRYRDQKQQVTTASLWATARHFAAAKRHAAAAEAVVTYVERLFEIDGGPGLLYGHHGRRSDRARRHRIYAALTEAEAQLELAHRLNRHEPNAKELSETRVRMLTARSRFKAIMGDFAEARGTAELAVELGADIKSESVRLEALRVHLEVCYASGDTNAARTALVRVLDVLNDANQSLALPVYVWLSEAFAKWEWPGLHGRLFPFIIEQATQSGGHKEQLQISMEWLAALAQTNEEQAMTDALEQAIEYAKAHDLLGFLAELMVKRSTEIIQLRVDGHYDLLSGEFYVPDLFGEGFGPTVQPLSESLGDALDLLERAKACAVEMKDPLTELRVSTGCLSIILETRERLTDLLERWLPIQRDEQPVRLTEVADFLASGFFSVANVETFAERIMLLAGELNLHQILADTVYEMLDRELPVAMARSGTLFDLARTSYEEIGDTYGLTTLSLVQARYEARRGENPMDSIDRGLHLLQTGHDQWTTEQVAYINLRFGEMLLEADGRIDEAIDCLETSMRLYDKSGDMEHLHAVGSLLHEVYRKQGDLGRYRAIRDRFRNLDQFAPGSDPLRLELRIEHLLSLARQEANDERAIEMVENCIQLFGRMPDGTTRIDECFVEISKICRRRADEAESETGFNGWLERSLDAIRIAVTINRGLNNYYRVFEELHELFDDLLGLGMFEEYHRVRAENRELAFAVGNIGELLYLFEEHLHYDADQDEGLIRLPEVRSFYEALFRYLLGLGATSDALSIQNAFVSFLTAVGQSELATHYKLQRLRYLTD